MAKFNFSMMKTHEKGQSETVLEEKKETEIEELNKESEMQEITTSISENQEIRLDAEMNIIYVPEEEIAYNPLNEEISKDGIEELAQLIVMNNGLEQPLVIRAYTEQDGSESYKYMLLTGERRLRAIRHNKENGIMSDYLIPCMIKEVDTIPLPLSNELKEEFAIAVSNKYRNKTDGDLYLESIRWKKIYKALKEAGETYINYTDAEGNIVEQKSITGKRVRELVAEEMGISVGTEQTIEEVDKKAVDDIKKLLLSGKTNLVTAHAVSKLDPEEQKKIAENTEGTLTRKDVREHLIENDTKEIFTKEMWEEDMQKLTHSFDGTEIFLNTEQKKEYQKAIKILMKLLGEKNVK